MWCSELLVFRGWSLNYYFALEQRLWVWMSSRDNSLLQRNQLQVESDLCKLQNHNLAMLSNYTNELIAREL